MNYFLSSEDGQESQWPQFGPTGYSDEIEQNLHESRAEFEVENSCTTIQVRSLIFDSCFMLP